MRKRHGMRSAGKLRDEPPAVVTAYSLLYCRSLNVLLLRVPHLLGARAHHGDETKHGGFVRCTTPAKSHDTTIHFESDSLVPQRQAISAPGRLLRWSPLHRFAYSPARVHANLCRLLELSLRLSSLRLLDSCLDLPRRLWESASCLRASRRVRTRLWTRCVVCSRLPA